MQITDKPVLIPTDNQLDKCCICFCKYYNLLFAKVLIISESVNLNRSFFIRNDLFRQRIIKD